MRQQACLGIILVSSIALLANCGGDDKKSGTGGDNSSGGSSSGGSSSGGSSSGGSSSGGTSSGGTSSGGTSSGGSSSGGTSSGGTSSGGTSSGGSSSGGSAGQSTDGGASGEGGAAGDANVSEPVACPSVIEDLPQAFAEAVCQKRVECCVDDYETCLVEVSAAMGEIYVAADESVEAGTAALDCTAFDACSLAISEAACEDWPFQVGDAGQIPVDEPACRAMVTPLVEAGDDCTSHFECIDGFCSDTCQAFLAEGDPCDSGWCTVHTTFCNDDDVCQAMLANGEVCTDDEQCVSGICDTDDTELCVAPGDDMCEYTPSAPASCSLGGNSWAGKQNGWPLLFALGGLGVVVVRRRRALSL